jgi:hypothetical protein
MDIQHATSFSIRLRVSDLVHNLRYRNKRIQQRRDDERCPALHLDVLQNPGMTRTLLSKRYFGLYAHGRF